MATRIPAPIATNGRAPASRAITQVSGAAIAPMSANGTAEAQATSPKSDQERDLDDRRQRHPVGVRRDRQGRDRRDLAADLGEDPDEVDVEALAGVQGARDVHVVRGIRVGRVREMPDQEPADDEGEPVQEQGGTHGRCSVAPGFDRCRPVRMAYPAATRMTAMMADVPRIFRSKSVHRVLIAASVIGLLIGLDTLVLHLRLDPLADVRAYYDAGARLNAGLPLYVQTATTDDPGFYRYPPLLAIAFRPLALLSYETAALIWEAFLIVLFIGTLVRLGLRNEWTWIVTGWLAAPIAWSLAVGQAQVAVTFLVALGAPWAVALAANVKLLPVFVALFWVGRRDWRAVGRFAAWMVGLVVLQFVLEPSATIAFLGFSDLAQVGTVENMSLYGFSPILWAASVVLLIGLALRYAPTRAGWALAVSASVLVSPRLLMYQLSTLQAGVRSPDAPATEPATDAVVPADPLSAPTMPS